MRESDPGMLGIPDDGRDRAKGEDDEQEIKIGPAEFKTQSRNEEEREKDRDQLERIREFAEKAQADEQSRERPPPGEVRAAFEREPEGVKRRHPKENRERINRQDEAPEVKDRRDIQCDHCPETGQRAEQVLRKIIKKQA